MSLSDDHPIKITSPDYRPSGQGELEQWLGREMDAKLASTPKLEDNEDTSTANYSDLYDNPSGRKDGSNVDGVWGKKPHEVNGKQDPAHNNNATFAAANKERQEVTSRAFDTFPAASAVEKALLAKNLDHAASGDFTSHSLLLQPGTKQASASLSDRVKSILGTE